MAVAGLPKEQLDDALTQLVNSELIFCRGEVPAIGLHVQACARAATQPMAACSRAGACSFTPRSQTHLSGAFRKLSKPSRRRWRTISRKRRLFERAFHYWLTAGKKAALDPPISRRLHILNVALRRSREVPDSPTKDRQELDLRLVLGPCLIATQGPASATAVETFIRARSTVRTARRSAGISAGVVLADDRQCDAGELPLARETITAVLDRALARGDQAGFAQCHARTSHDLAVHGATDGSQFGDQGRV